MAYGVTYDDVQKFSLLNTLDTRKTKYRLSNAPASFYVRILAPRQFVKALTNPKQLTMKIIKFGMTDNVPSRDYNYLNDNGFMAFTFECDKRSEASIVERIMKTEYADLTVLDSLEYVDAVGLAQLLGQEYDESSYESYVLLARKLFVHMVETVQLVFPAKYLGKYGLVHKVKGGATALTGAGETIDQALAVEYGFMTPTTTWSPLSHEAQEVSISPVSEKVSRLEAAARALRAYKDMYGVPDDTDMRQFYDCLVSPKNAKAMYERWKRCNLLKSDGMDTDSCDPKFDAVLFHGRRILESLLAGDALQEVKHLGSAQVQEADVVRVMGEHFGSMTPEKKAKFYKLFDIRNDDVTTFALFSKVMVSAFSLDVTRGSTSTKRKPYTALTINNACMASIQERFRPTYPSIDS